MNIKKIGETQYGGRVYDYKEMKANEGKLNKYHFYFGDVAYNGKDYFLILEGKVVEYLRVPNTKNLNDFLNIKYLEENKMYYHLEKLNNVEVYIASEYEEYVSVIMLVEFMKHVAKVEELGDKWYTAVRKLISGANFNIRYYNINKDLKMKKVVDGKVEYVGVEVIELAEDVYDDEYYDIMEEFTPLNPYKEKTTLKEAMIVKGNKTKEKAKENMENEINYEKELDEKVVKQAKTTVKEQPQVKQEVEVKQTKPTVKETPKVKQEVEVKQTKPTVKETPQVKQEVEVKQDKPTVKEQPKVEQKDTTKVKPFSFNNIQEVEEYIRLKKQNRMKEQQKEVTQNNEPQGEKVELQAPKPTNTIVKKMLGTTRKANTNKLFSNSKQIITSTHTENIEGMLYDTS